VGDNYYQTEKGGFDHTRFADMVTNLDGKWLISYDENIPSALSDFHSVERTKTTDMATDKSEKTETLTMNYDPENTPMFREKEQTGLEAYD
jgi:site-specific DNA-adenine methylase